jgi:hypothetical protein
MSLFLAAHCLKFQTSYFPILYFKHRILLRILILYPGQFYSFDACYVEIWDPFGVCLFQSWNESWAWKIFDGRGIFWGSNPLGSLSCVVISSLKSVKTRGLIDRFLPRNDFENAFYMESFRFISYQFSMPLKGPYINIVY